MLSGIHPQYFIALTNESKPVRDMLNKIQAMIDDETVDESVIIKKLGRHAIGKLAELMESNSEAIALKAAQDLADRAPATSKTHKIEMHGLMIGSGDAKELARALVEASQPSPLFHQVVKDGLVEIRDNDMGMLPPGGESVDL